MMRILIGCSLLLVLGTAPPPASTPTTDSPDIVSGGSIWLGAVVQEPDATYQGPLGPGDGLTDFHGQMRRYWPSAPCPVVIQWQGESWGEDTGLCDQEWPRYDDPAITSGGSIGSP